jgi:hypothetical protein
MAGAVVRLLMRHQAILDAFDARRPALEALRIRLESELSAMLKTSGIAIQFVASRTKSHASLRQKLARPDKTYARLEDVTDLVGVRVATYFEDSIADVAHLIEQRYRVDFANSTDKLGFADHGKFGYRSLHYVLSAPDDADVGRDFRFEIQVRTVLQHAWAEIEHDLGYKASEGVPEAIRRRFSRVAGLLEIADQEFVAIRADLARYQADVRAAMNDPARSVQVDLVSLEAVARSEAVAAIDRALAQAIDRPLVNELYFPAYLVTLLRGAGLATTRDIDEAIERHGSDALALVAPYFEFAERAFQLSARSLDGIKQGYGLFFLAHAVILRGSGLGISKVQKLASLYEKLDYPGDERTAHAIASELALALAPRLDRAEKDNAGS